MFGKSLGIVAIAVLVAGPAFAQTPQDAPKQSIGGGARWAYPASTPLAEGTLGLDVSWRGWFNRHAGLEVSVGNWRTTNTIDTREPFRTFTEQVSSYSFGASVVGRIPVGRVSFLVGGGPGYFMDVETNRVWVRDEFRSLTNTRGGFGAQIVAEVEVRATGNISVFAGVRNELRDITHGSESAITNPTAGIRFSF